MSDDLDKEINKTKEGNSQSTSKFHIYVAIFGIIMMILIPFIQEYLQHKVKALEFICDSRIALVDVHKDVKRHVKIYYKNVEIYDLTKAQFRLINTGNVPIISTKDVLQPITMIFPKGVKILSAKVTPRPVNIITQAQIDKAEEGRIVLNFDVLEKDDTLGLEVLLAGRLNKPPKVTARILGLQNKQIMISDRSEVTPETQKPLFSEPVIFLMAFMGALLSYVSRIKNFHLFTTRRILFNLFMNIFFAALLVGFIIQPDSAIIAFLLGFGVRSIFEITT